MTAQQPIIQQAMLISNEISQEKRAFIPFKEERDHLGRLLDSVRNLLMIRNIVTSKLHADPSTEVVHQKTLDHSPKKGWLHQTGSRRRNSPQMERIMEERSKGRKGLTLRMQIAP